MSNSAPKDTSRHPVWGALFRLCHDSPALVMITQTKPYTRLFLVTATYTSALGYSSTSRREHFESALFLQPFLVAGNDTCVFDRPTTATPILRSTQASLSMSSTDRAALLALYRLTGGASWKRKNNWDTDGDLSQWDGVRVNDQGRVVSLRLDHNNLTGILQT